MAFFLSHSKKELQKPIAKAEESFHKTIQLLQGLAKGEAAIS